MTGETGLKRLHEQIIAFSQQTRLSNRDMYDGLGFLPVAILGAVAASPCAHAADLAAMFALDKSTLSRQVAELAANGLLVREPDPNHSRMLRLSLTDVGHDRLRRIRHSQADGLAAALSDWSTEEIDTFSRLFEKFVHRVDQRAETGVDSRIY